MLPTNSLYFCIKEQEYEVIRTEDGRNRYYREGFGTRRLQKTNYRNGLYQRQGGESTAQCAVARPREISHYGLRSEPATQRSRPDRSNGGRR